MKLFTGNSTVKLASLIANKLKIDLGKAVIDKFSDGEIKVRIKEKVRGEDVFVIQSTCKPTNDNIMELLIIIDALRRASARRITAVIPYFGYARQDRRTNYSREPITAKIVANFLSVVGTDRVITVDLHAEQIQGFFDIPIDNIFAGLVFSENIKKTKLRNPIIVSPDIGGIFRARLIAKLLYNIDMAIIDKKRPKSNTTEVMNIIGNVFSKDCILVDDIIDTGSTFCKAAEALKINGARKVYSYATHAVLSGNAVSNLKNSVIDEIIVCDTIPLSKLVVSNLKIRILTLSDILAKAITKINREESILRPS